MKGEKKASGKTWRVKIGVNMLDTSNMGGAESVTPFKAWEEKTVNCRMTANGKEGTAVWIGCQETLFT